jgi:hypothetical protein
MPGRGPPWAVSALGGPALRPGVSLTRASVAGSGLQSAAISGDLGRKLLKAFFVFSPRPGVGPPK